MVSIRLRMLPEQLAIILDFNGSIGIRLGRTQLQPYIIIYSNHRDCLDWLRFEQSEFSVPRQVNRLTWMSQVVSISGVHKVLDGIIGYLNRLEDVGALALRFCKLRLDHPTEKYNLGELQIIEDIIRATARPSSMKRRLEVLEKWK